MLSVFKQNHPKGLYLLFFVEMWERFSFYGMRALIVLYMIQNLMYSAQKAGTIYGLYTGLVYLTPLLGGFLADRFLGQRKCITAGAVLMSIGLFLLAFGHKSLFLFSLFLMITANGFFKSNISSVLGLLYGDNNEKKDSGFTIFYMGINLGAFFSPLICGTLAAKFGYEYGFAAAGLGMLAGLLLYKLLENKLLGDCGLSPVKNIKSDSTEKTVTKNQKEQIFSLLLLMVFTVPFWICFEQAGSSLTLFAQYNTNRIIFGHEIPTGYFQALNPMFILILAPLISSLWGLKGWNKITSVEKFGISLFLMTCAYILMTFAGYISESAKVSALWLAAIYFVMTIAELCLSPIGLSLVSKLAPKQFLSLIMGCWFLTSFFGNMIAGLWGGEYGSIPNYYLFGALAILSFTACILLLRFIPKLNKML